MDPLMIAQSLGPSEQEHLLVARQMQALSFAVHIPLVCFGIAFPAMVLFMEWWSLRTGDPLHRTIARRWSLLGGSSSSLRRRCRACSRRR